MLKSLTYKYNHTLVRFPWRGLAETIDFTGVSVDWFVQRQSPFHLFYNRVGYHLRYF